MKNQDKFQMPNESLYLCNSRVFGKYFIHIIPLHFLIFEVDIVTPFNSQLWKLICHSVIERALTISPHYLSVG